MFYIFRKWCRIIIGKTRSDENLLLQIIISRRQRDQEHEPMPCHEKQKAQGAMQQILGHNHIVDTSR